MHEKKITDELPPLVPEKQLAEFLHRHPDSLRRLRRAGLIAWRKIGGVYYAREDIEEFLERTKRPAEIA